MDTLNMIINSFVVDVQSSAVKALEEIGIPTDEAIKTVVDSDYTFDLVQDSINNPFQPSELV